MSKSIKAVAALCIAAMLISTSVQAMQSSEDVQNQINSQQAELNNLKEEKEKVLNEIEQYANEVADTMSIIDDNNKKMDEIQGDIDKADADIKAAEEDEAKAREKYYERLQVMYKSNSNLIIDVLFSSSSLSDILQKLKVFEKIGETTEAILQDLKNKQAETKQKQEQLILENQKLEETKKQNEVYLSEVQAKLDKANSLASELKAQEEQKAKDLESSRSALAEIEQQQQQQQTALPATRGSENINYSKKLSMVATAYTSGNSGVGSRTASGLPVSRDPNGYSTVAVDPSVIPLGTKLYISGYGYAIAADTGGSVKRNKIDLYFDSNAECFSWGVRLVEVMVVE